MSRSSSGRQRRGSRSWAEPDGCDYVIKTILLGDLGVGKTSFLHTFLSQSCCNGVSNGRPHTGQQVTGQKNILCPSTTNPDKASSRKSRTGQSSKQTMVFCSCQAERGAPHGSCRTGQDSSQRIVLYQGKKVALTVWDTAGQERYRSLTASYYRGAHACIVMYDEQNEDSFSDVIMWLDTVEDYRDTTSAGIQIVLVGTVRSDTNHGIPSSSSSHKVDRQRAQNLAAHYQIPHFLVDSRADPYSVQQVLDSVVTLVMTRALDNQQLSQSITPYSTKLQQLAGKSRHSSCGRCCLLM